MLMAGQTCPLCNRVIVPGEKVAFQFGALVHLDCYAEWSSAGPPDTATAESPD
jgi:hypothetical protein